MDNIYQEIYKNSKIEDNYVLKFSEAKMLEILREERFDNETIKDIFKNVFLDYIDELVSKDESFAPLFKEKKESRDREYDRAEKILSSIRHFLIYYNCEKADIYNTDFENEPSINILMKNKNTSDKTTLEENEEIGYRIICKIMDVFTMMIKEDEKNKFKVKLLIQIFIEGKSIREIKKEYYVSLKLLCDAKTRSINSFSRALRKYLENI